MPFDFPAVPIVGDQYTSGGAIYTWDGITWNLLSGGMANEYVLKAGDVMSGMLSFGNVTAADINDLSKHICLYDGGTTSPFGFNIRSGTLGYVVGNIANRHAFSVGGAERAIIDQNGIGPRTNYNIVWENGFSGTAQFRVNPSMVSLTIYDVSKNDSVNGSGGHVFKMFGYPSGVPGPWSALRQYVMATDTSTMKWTNRQFFIDCKPDAVYFILMDGGAECDYITPYRFSAHFNWSR